jgi:hypothetical protein
MNDAIKIDDIKTIKNVAHKIKPMIDSLEIRQLKEVIRELESSPDIFDSVMITKHIRLIEEVMEQVIHEMKLII